jgi:hypothetical protein
LNHRLVASKIQRYLCVLAPLWVIGTLASVERAQAEDLLVYYPSTIPAKEREQALKADYGGTVVYGRFKDFYDSMQQQKPDIFVGPDSVASLFKDYHAIAKFQELGKSESRYIALALSGQWKPTTVTSGKMGAVGKLMRKSI